MQKIDQAELNIIEITVPSVGEIDPMPFKTMAFQGNLWWLRNAADSERCAAFVDGNGVNHVKHGIPVTSQQVEVRPALRIDNLAEFDLKPKDTVQIAGREWVVVTKDLVLCTGTIGRCPYREADHLAFDTITAPDGSTISEESINKWADSDLKKFVEKWGLEQGLITKAQIHEDALGHNNDNLVYDIETR